MYIFFFSGMGVKLIESTNRR